MAPKALNIFVAGGVDQADPTALGVEREKIIEFVKLLGAQIVKQRHNLISGCQTEVDQLVAESAAKELESHPPSPLPYS